MRRFLYLAFIVILLATTCLRASFAFAEDDNVRVRSGIHPNYNRIVFDWTKTPPYKTSQTDHSFTIMFEKNATPDLKSVVTRYLPYIQTVKLESKTPLKITFTVSPDTPVKESKSGAKLILDFYAPEPKEAKADIKTETKAETKPNPKKQSVEKTTQATEKTITVAPLTPEDKGENETISAPAPVKDKKERTAPPTEEKKSETEIAQAVPLPEENTAAPAPIPHDNLLHDALEPHLITLNATKRIGLSVFIRGKTLWIVTDDPELPVPPQISGPYKEKFGILKQVKMEGGTAFKLPLPDDAYKLYGEGGGLLWRLSITPTKREDDKKGITPERLAGDGAQPYNHGAALLWKLHGVSRILTLHDPERGDDINVITVTSSAKRAEDHYEFTAFKTLPSIIGMALIPYIDDLEIKDMNEGIKITRPGGLSISSKDDVLPILMKKTALKKVTHKLVKGKNLKQIFNFSEWKMGDFNALEENERLLFTSAASKKDPSAKAEDLLTLGKLMLSNARGQEALGYFNTAQNILPGLEDVTQFIALRGAARALSNKYAAAIEDLYDPDLNQYGEINYWRAYALAGLEDWQQAISILPESFDLLASYPRRLRDPLSLTMSEIALRAGRTPLAEGLLGMLEHNIKQRPKHSRAAWTYLTGETQKQLGNYANAKAIWQILLDNDDNLYRTKAGLSLTKLETDSNTISFQKATDRLEGLRYAWRGDGLETLINFRLGQVYINGGDYVKGLSVLRNAVSFTPHLKIADDIAEYMTKEFRDLFLKDKLKDISPLDAVTVYDEFKELTPAGPEANLFVYKLAERLIEADLLGRAGKLLEHQVNHRLEGEEKANVAIKLAAVRLMDDKADGALRALDVARKTFTDIANSKGEDPPADRIHEIDLLTARALSKTNQVDKALAILDQFGNEPEVNRLRADIAWNASRWDEAANAFQDIILAENITPRDKLKPEQIEIIMNRAIALNLSGNRVALGNLRERYKTTMGQTDQGRIFDVITRPRQLGLLGNRETVTSLISEVDMFGDFLSSYKKSLTE